MEDGWRVMRAMSLWRRLMTLRTTMAITARARAAIVTMMILIRVVMKIGVTRKVMTAMLMATMEIMVAVIVV